MLDAHETFGPRPEGPRNDWGLPRQPAGRNRGTPSIADVDSITGATITSSAVLSAVNNAAKFMADSGVGADGALTGEGSGFGGPITVEVTMDGDDITSVTIVSNSETPSIGGRTRSSRFPAAIVEADTARCGHRGRRHLHQQRHHQRRQGTPSARAGGGGTDGALTGTADGFIGPITVEVTMDGDTITSVTVVDNSETLNIASGALEQIPEAIVAAPIRPTSTWLREQPTRATVS